LGNQTRRLEVGRRRFVTLDSRLLDLNSTEQSENVIENKGSSWKTRLFFGIFEHGRTYDKDDQSEIPRAAPFKVCHSERSEESALVRPGPELQILRFAQDDRDFDLHGWAAGPCPLGMKL